MNSYGAARRAIFIRLLLLLVRILADVSDSSSVMARIFLAREFAVTTGSGCNCNDHSSEINAFIQIPFLASYQQYHLNAISFVYTSFLIQ